MAQDISVAEEADRVLVRSTDKLWDVRLVLGLGLVAGCAAALCLWVRIPRLAVLASGVALLCFGGGVLWYVWRRLSRRWVQATPEGFLWIDAAGREQTHADDDVVCIAHATKSLYANGDFRGVDRRFTVWLEQEGRHRKLVWTNRLKPGQVDPLGGLIQRLTQHLVAGARAALAAGEIVEGEGWWLDRRELMVPHGRETAGYPVADLTALDIFDDHICVWRRGQDDPVLRLPLSKANSHLLWLLLQDLVKPPADEELPEGSLGRLLFERRPSGTGIVLAWLAAALFGVTGLCVLGAGIAAGRMGMVYTGGGVACAGGLLALLAIALRFQAFRCHALGVSQTSLFGRRLLRYTDVGTFTFSQTKMYHKGVYTGTALAMNFQPLPGTAGRAITYGTTVRQADESLEQIRDHIAQVIARRLAHEFDEHQAVAWLPHLQVQRSGLEYRPRGWFGRKEPIHIPWPEIAGAEFQQGVFHIWRRGQTKSVVHESVDQPNFFPGYVLFCTILSPPAPE